MEGSSYYHTELRGFRCPLDPTGTDDPFYGPGNYATNNLALACRVRRATDFADGAATTVLFAEKYAACSYWALAEGVQVPSYAANRQSGFQTRPAVCDPKRPQTAHRGGMPVGMADGSIRIVSPSIRAATWFAANTPAGKEELGSGLYSDW